MNANEIELMSPQERELLIHSFRRAIRILDPDYDAVRSVHRMLAGGFEPEDDDKVLLSIHTVARLLDTPEDTVRKWCKAGRLPSHRIGRTVRVYRRDFLLFLRDLREGRLAS